MGHDIDMPALALSVRTRTRTGSTPYFVPLFMAEAVDITKGRDSCPPSVVDNDVQTSKCPESLLDQPCTVFYRSDVLDWQVSTCETLLVQWPQVWFSENILLEWL